MISKRHALPGPVEAALPLVAATALAVSAAFAQAAELKVPQASPEVVMDIPDGWAVEQSKSGFEIRSPEKNSIIVGHMMVRDKKALETFRKEAGEKLKAFGVAFDPNAKAPPAKAGETPAPKTDAKSGAKADDGTSAFTTSPDRFTFSGAPSLRTPGTEGSNKPVKPGETSIEKLTEHEVPKEPALLPKLPFRAVQIYGAALNGKPVDVQLVIYSVSDNRLFVMMQESGPDDGRAVAMAQSVRSADGDAKKDAK